MRRSLRNLLFAGGWAFFLPYHALYLGGLALDLTNGQLRSAFLVVHLLLFGIFADFSANAVFRRYRRLGDALRDPSAWFWVLLLASFLIPGGNFEFPGDPWEHLRRINIRRPDQPLRLIGAYLGSKFTYYWGWTFLCYVEPLYQRLAASVYACFWQMLLAVQFHRFACRLGFPAAWAKATLIGVVALFGNNVFGFFAYYPLAATVLAHIAYLRAAIAVLDIADGRARETRAVPAIVAALGIMTLNHVQAVLFFLVFAAAVAYLRISSMLPRVAPLASAAVGAGGLIFGRAMSAGLGYPTPPFGRPWISSWGCFRIWDPGYGFYTTIGLHGLLAALLAVLLCRRRPLVAAVTLAPFVLALFPPFVLSFLTISSPWTTYRVFFVLPSSFMLVAAFHEIANRGHARFNSAGWERLWLGIATAFLLLLGAHGTPPVYGKLRFQYERPPAPTIDALDVTAQWFADNRVLHPGCVITSDGITEFVLAALLGHLAEVEKTTGQHLVAKWPAGAPLTTQDLLDYRDVVGVCGYLAVDSALFAKILPPAAPSSWAGTVSKHWPPEAAHLPSRVPMGFVRATEGLVRAGWTKTFVPPYYWYYEPLTPPRYSWPIGADRH